MTEINLETIPSDPEIEDQKWVVVSYAPHPENNLIYFKFRGAFQEHGQAIQRASYLNQIDNPKIPIYVAPMGIFIDAPIPDSINPYENSNNDKPNLAPIPINIINEPTDSEITEETAKAAAEATEIANGEETENPSVKLSNDILCLACYTEKRNMMFMPCRHINFCSSCINEHTKISSKCPICRQPIKEILNVFF